MSSRTKLSLVLLGAVALGVLALVLLQDGGAPEATGPLNDLSADGVPARGGGQEGRTPDGGGGARGADPVRSPARAGGGSDAPGALVGARTPEGIDLSRPETRAAELKRLLTAVPVDDWLAVARIVELMPQGEAIPAELRSVILNELQNGKRLQVMHVFAQLRDDSFVADLFDILESSTADKGVVTAALEALWKMPGGDDDAIAKRLESSLRGDPQKDGAVLRAIGKRGGAEAARAIVEYLQRSKNPSDVQLHILQSLDITTDPAAAEIVREALVREASPKVQRALITMAMQPGASVMTDSLIGLDRDGVNDDVRTQALKALGRIADAKATEYLLKKAGEPGLFGEQAMAAIEHLESGDPKVGDLLAQALADADRNPRPAVAKASFLEALGTARHVASLPTVARSLDDRDPAVQTAAIRAMGRMGESAREYVPRIVQLFAAGDARHQQRVAVALADIGGEAAIKAIRGLLEAKDLDPSVQRTLQMGLRNAEARSEQAPK